GLISHPAYHASTPFVLKSVENRSAKAWSCVLWLTKTLGWCLGAAFVPPERIESGFAGSSRVGFGRVSERPNERSVGFRSGDESIASFRWLEFQRSGALSSCRRRSSQRWKDPAFINQSFRCASASVFCRTPGVKMQ